LRHWLRFIKEHGLNIRGGEDEMNLKALYTISYGLYVIGSRKGDRLNG
jgi:hypothetical protein